MAAPGDILLMTTSALARPARATASAHGRSFSVSLKLLDGYAFRVDFDSELIEPLVTDEPKPLGEDQGPSPSRLLVAAVANCLAASLLHCLRKSGVTVKGLEASAVGTMSRNEYGRWRVERIAVLLDPRVPREELDALEGCVERFEEYCIVTESVRQGIDVQVTVATGIAEVSDPCNRSPRV
jgi:uncharacterized OsmC-like protein